MEMESVWRALTSPHRRALLDALREGPQTTGQLTKVLPGLTRFAVMQHLDVLVDANLVLVRRDGRQRYNYANPMPLRDIYDRWVSKHASAAAGTVQQLREYVHSQTTEDKMKLTDFNVSKIELEVEIASPPQRVFDALTKNLNDWWPHRMNPASTVTHDCAIGGLIAERWEGGGVIYGYITLWEEGRSCRSTISGFMGPMSATNLDLVEATSTGTLYKKSLHLWGEVPAELEKMFAEGSAALMRSALKAYCEEGTTYVC